MTSGLDNERGRRVTSHQQVIAIDGPAAAGKSTVAHLLAERLGALLFDTGALYRVVALLALRARVNPGDADELCRLAADAEIRVSPPRVRDGRLYDVWVDDEDVTWAVRDPEVGSIVSQVSEHAEVRAALLPLQRQIASSGPVVMVGRDIGTIVVPDAGLKIYLDASPHERAIRRYKESLARGSHVTFADVLAETVGRDSIDSNREIAPMRAASDAIRITTDELSVNDVVTRIERLARQLTAPSGELIWAT
jgi:cytidylate kinase